jgi:hypothetical protein
MNQLAVSRDAKCGSASSAPVMCMRKPVDDPRRARLSGKILPLYEKAKSRIRRGQIKNEEIGNCHGSPETDTGVATVGFVVRLGAMALTANGTDVLSR